MGKRRKHEERPPEAEAPADAPEASAASDEWRERYLRTLAELDNYRKRMEREREQARAYGEEGLLRDLLPVLDDLELAQEAEGGADAIREGVRVALQRLAHVLSSHGLEAIEALDLPFDPRFHEAMGAVPGSDKPAGTIVGELRKGYRLKDRVLRPSRVQIAMDPPPEQEEGDAPADPGAED